MKHTLIKTEYSLEGKIDNSTIVVSGAFDCKIGDEYTSISNAENEKIIAIKDVTDVINFFLTDGRDWQVWDNSSESNQQRYFECHNVDLVDLLSEFKDYIKQ